MNKFINKLVTVFADTRIPHQLFLLRILLKPWILRGEPRNRSRSGQLHYLQSALTSQPSQCFSMLKLPHRWHKSWLLATCCYKSPLLSRKDLAPPKSVYLYFFPIRNFPDTCWCTRLPRVPSLRGAALQSSTPILQHNSLHTKPL